ncbi:hypothetical protein BDQ17DRAFT_1332548 [Cyathus striatus]|nr:hypothetical protein BDQ17DRAFT_1332548 [Cyathus striatus]
MTKTIESPYTFTLAPISSHTPAATPTSSHRAFASQHSLPSYSARYTAMTPAKRAKESVANAHTVMLEGALVVLVAYWMTGMFSLAIVDEVDVDVVPVQRATSLLSPPSGTMKTPAHEVSLYEGVRLGGYIASTSCLMPREPEYGVQDSITDQDWEIKIDVFEGSAVSVINYAQSIPKYQPAALATLDLVNSLGQLRPLIVDTKSIQ